MISLTKRRPSSSTPYLADSWPPALRQLWFRHQRVQRRSASIDPSAGGLHRPLLVGRRFVISFQILAEIEYGLRRCDWSSASYPAGSKAHRPRRGRVAWPLASRRLRQSPYRLRSNRPRSRSTGTRRRPLDRGSGDPTPRASRVTRWRDSRSSRSRLRDCADPLKPVSRRRASPTVCDAETRSRGREARGGGVSMRCR